MFSSSFAAGMFPGGVVFGTVDSSGISSGTTRKYGWTHLNTK